LQDIFFQAGNASLSRPAGWYLPFFYQTLS
jgi:hypothetical protein